jgi:hypothetical protein
MTYRRSLTGLLGAAVLVVAACAGTGSSGGSVSVPSVAVPTAMPSVALEGFCEEFATQLEAKWPNIDASTATTLAPIVQKWAAKPEMASVQADVTTLGTWLASMATAGTVSSPTPEAATAFDHLKAFADANC